MHTITFAHPFGAVWPLGKIFNFGPNPKGGSRETINCGYYLWGKENPFAVMVGPALRHVSDMSWSDESLMVIDTGESGQPGSAHYHDQAEMWLKGDLMKISLDRSRIEESAKDVFVITPAD